MVSSHEYLVAGSTVTSVSVSQGVMSNEYTAGECIPGMQLRSIRQKCLDLVPAEQYGTNTNVSVNGAIAGRPTIQ